MNYLNIPELKFQLIRPQIVHYDVLMIAEMS